MVHLIYNFFSKLSLGTCYIEDYIYRELKFYMLVLKLEMTALIFHKLHKDIFDNKKFEIFLNK